VTSLSIGTNYWFRVAPINSVGVGAISPLLSTSTRGQVPSAPISLAITVTGSTYTLSWNAPSAPGGVITNYLVEISSNGGSTWSSVSKPVSTSRSLTLSPLTARTTYKARVYAVNATGTSPASNVLSFTTK
jgi:hypothetical protein